MATDDDDDDDDDDDRDRAYRHIRSTYRTMPEKPDNAPNYDVPQTEARSEYIYK